MEVPKQGPTDRQIHSLILFNQDHRKEGLKDLAKPIPPAPL